MYHDLWGRKQTFGIIVRKVCKHSNKITNSSVKKKKLSSRALLESLDINLAHLMSKTCFWISNVFLLQEFTLGKKKAIENSVWLNWFEISQESHLK